MLRSMSAFALVVWGVGLLWFAAVLYVQWTQLTNRTIGANLSELMSIGPDLIRAQTNGINPEKIAGALRFRIFLITLFGVLLVVAGTCVGIAGKSRTRERKSRGN